METPEQWQRRVFATACKHVAPNEYLQNHVLACPLCTADAIRERDQEVTDAAIGLNAKTWTDRQGQAEIACAAQLNAPQEKSAAPVDPIAAVALRLRERCHILEALRLAEEALIRLTGWPDAEREDDSTDALIARLRDLRVHREVEAHVEVDSTLATLRTRAAALGFTPEAIRLMYLNACDNNLGDTAAALKLLAVTLEGAPPTAPTPRETESAASGSVR